MKSPIRELIDMKDDLPFTPGKPLQHAVKKAGIEADEEDATDSSHMAGRLEGREAIIRYIEAGKARFTVRSKKTGQRFTFRAKRPSKEQQEARNVVSGYAAGNSYGIVRNANANTRPIWVAVLTGQDNNTSYEFLGTIWPSANGYSFRRSPKSRISETAPSCLAIQWLCKALNGASAIDQCEVWHEGRCGRCGRVLTVPESVGPECIGKL